MEFHESYIGHSRSHEGGAGGGGSVGKLASTRRGVVKAFSFGVRSNFLWVDLPSQTSYDQTNILCPQNGQSLKLLDRGGGGGVGERKTPETAAISGSKMQCITQYNLQTQSAKP